MLRPIHTYVRAYEYPGLVGWKLTQPVITFFHTASEFGPIFGTLFGRVDGLLCKDYNLLPLTSILWATFPGEIYSPIPRPILWMYVKNLGRCNPRFFDILIAHSISVQFVWILQRLKIRAYQPEKWKWTSFIYIEFPELFQNRRVLHTCSDWAFGCSKNRPLYAYVCLPLPPREQEVANSQN